MPARQPTPHTPRRAPAPRKRPPKPTSTNPHEPLANPVRRAADRRSNDEPIKHRYTPREDKGLA